MTYFLIFCAVILALSPLGLFPRVKWDQSRSAWSLTRITLAPESYYADYHAQTGQPVSRRATYAQERVEHWLAWATAVAFGLLVSVPVSMAVEDRLVEFAVSFIALVLGLGISGMRWWKMQSELIGHEAECVAAASEGLDYRTYLQAEASRTFANRIAYPFFYKSYADAAELADAMDKRRALARALVALQAIPLRRMPK